MQPENVIRLFSPPLGQTEHCRACGGALTDAEEDAGVCETCVEIYGEDEG